MNTVRVIRPGPYMTQYVQYRDLLAWDDLFHGRIRSRATLDLLYRRLLLDWDGARAWVIDHMLPRDLVRLIVSFL